MKRLPNLKNNKMARMIVPIAIIAVFIGVPLLISVLGGGETKSLVASLEVVEVEVGNISEELQITGTVESENQKTFLSPVNATISECNVKVGQVVQKGDVLITFELDDLETNNKQSQLSELQAESERSSALASNQQLLDDVSDADARIVELETAIAAQEATIEDWKNDMTTVNTRITELTSWIEQLNAAIESSLANTDESATTDETVTTEVAELNLQLEAAMNEQMELTNQLTTLTSEIERVSQNLATNEAELAQQEMIVESGDSAMTTDQIEILNISSELAELASLETEDLLEKGREGIIAEFDGVIASVQVSEGTLVAQGTSLVTIASNEEVGVTVEVSTSEFDSLDVGDEAEITIKDYTYQGEVSEMNQIATVDATGSSVIGAVVKITNPDENIFLGIDAKTTIRTESKEDILVIPSSVINTSTDGEFVYVIEEGIVVKKIIEVGISDLDNIEVVSGLNQGELVVSDLVSVITEGMSAEPILEGMNVGSTMESVNSKMSLSVTRSK
ncbi:MAG: efflux RND transporter periplasmic adaptor subunit [Eubacteriales bacterium]